MMRNPTVEVEIEKLRLAEYNPRWMPEDQMKALMRSIKNEGFLQDVIVNKDNTVIGGHQRIEAAKRLGMKTVPCTYVDVSKSREKTLNLALNKIHGEWNEVKLKAILDELQSDFSVDIANTGFSQEEIDELASNLDALTEEHGEVPEEEDEDDEDFDPDTDDWGYTGNDELTQFGVWELSEYPVFPSTNEWGIPDLMPDMLETKVPRLVKGTPDDRGDIVLWGSIARPKDMSDITLAFYVDDDRFEQVWSDAARIAAELKRKGAKSAIAPNFSVYEGSPRAVQLFQLYKARWVSRYWQEIGVKIIPDIAVTDLASVEKYSLLGLPKKIPVASWIGHFGKGKVSPAELKDSLALFNAVLDRVEIGTLLIYGEPFGEMIKPHLSHRVNVVPTETFMERRVQQRKRGDTPPKDED